MPFKSPLVTLSISILVTLFSYISPSLSEAAPNDTFYPDQWGLSAINIESAWSFSKGSGATIANHYSNLAMNLHPELPDTLKRLAWLDLDSEPGQEYWAAMNLMGEYAAANHAVIHKRIAKALGSQILAGTKNHHNFAWLEKHDHREVVVHRKGATPAGKGVMGVIPGSMAAPAFVVRGRGVADSLESASHGAGRAMSRTKAKEQFNWKMIRPQLEAAGVKILSAGIDENPFAYKDIESVMAASVSLVRPIKRLTPLGVVKG